MDEKQYESVGDVMRDDVGSNCCGAPVYAPSDEWGICKDCGEYCEVVKDEK